MEAGFCVECDATLTTSARFCGHCGAETGLRKREYRQAARRTHGRLLASSRAVSRVFVGTILAMVFASAMMPDAYELPYLTFCVLTVAICALCVRALGPGATRRSFGGRPNLSTLSLGALVSVGGLAISVAYVWLLDGVAEDAQPIEGLGLIALALLVSAVLPAMVEEWACRGVLWVALRPVTTQATTIFVTASLFAALHGLNGGFVLEMPHRFVSGLLLGWLRAKTHSLWPCVLAHFLHNAIAIVWLGG